MNYTCYDECREQSNVVPTWKPCGNMCTVALCFILSFFFFVGGGIQFIFEKSNREKKSVVARCKTEENRRERPLRKIKEARRGGRENRRWRRRSVQQPAETPRVHETAVNRETLITAGDDDGALKRTSHCVFNKNVPLASQFHPQEWETPDDTCRGKTTRPWWYHKGYWQQGNGHTLSRVSAPPYYAT